MEIKRNKSTKVIVVAIAILLCLALAVGITGAFYQAQRRATGTVKMDKGIVIDYTGFDKGNGVWVRENETSFRLFSDTDVQPGEKISLNDAGIKANTTSVDFYARVKLSYEFYNGETPVALANPSDLITTSATFFGADWVDSGAGDGYYYYATGTTLNKFVSGGEYIDLFDTNARFIIEGADFTGAYPDGEGGGFVVDETTSINKIVVYLTLETLQGDVSAEELNTMGWKINVSSMVDFSKIEGEDARIETSVGKEETTENLNVSVDGAEEVSLNEVVFPYDTDTILTFDSNNVEYVNLTYTNGETETFEEVSTNSFKVNAKSSKGSVKGYTIGIFGGASEYNDIIYSTETIFDNNYITLTDGIAITGYFGNISNLTIPSSVRVKERDFKMVIDGYSTKEEWSVLFYPKIYTIQYPCTFNDNQVFNSISDLYIDVLGPIDGMSNEEFMTTYPTMEFKFKALCSTKSLIYSKQDVKAINYTAFQLNSDLTSVTIPDSITKIGDAAFAQCTNLTSISIGSGLTGIGIAVFSDCINLTNISVSASNEIFKSINNCLIEKSSNKLVYGCKNSIIPTDGSVTSIGDYAFDGCTGLTSITIPDGVTSIGDFAFRRCTSLNSITVPNSVTSTGWSTFSGCDSLQASITEDGISYLGNTTNKYVIAWKVVDNSLSSYTIKDGCEVIYDSCFRSCSSATEITLPNSVISIGEYAFYDCSGLTLITIPSGVTSIGEYAFYGCSGLTAITIPNSVTSIGNYAFNGCSGLTAITIPDSVTSIGYWAFLDCSSLTTVTIDASIDDGGIVINSALIKYATTVYVKTGLAVGSYITGSFTKQESSDKAGYDKYTKNA